MAVANSFQPDPRIASHARAATLAALAKVAEAIGVLEDERVGESPPSTHDSLGIRVVL